MIYGTSYQDPDDNEAKDSLMVMSQRVIDSMRVFSFKEFKQRIGDYHNLQKYSVPTKTTALPDDLLELLRQTAIEFKKNDQIGAYNSHRDTRSSLIRFCEFSGRGAGTSL